MATKAVRSNTFVWQGTDKTGGKKSGELTAPNLALVKAQLRKQGIAPTKVRKKTTSLFSGPKKKRITAEDTTLFTRQMATMMKAGVPLVQSFDVVADGLDNLSLKELIGAIKNDVAAGTARDRLPEAFLGDAVVEVAESSRVCHEQIQDGQGSSGRLRE